MPTAAPRPCTQPGCRALVTDGSGRCEQHPRAAWRKARMPTKRIRGRRLQAMRAALFQRKPLCEVCEGLGLVTRATIRDHRIPLAEGGADDESNEQAICAPCHEGKSLAEALRGRLRGR
jgi:5-methylcytosine-specific restriction protein A